MNAKLTARLQAALEATLLLTAFALPLAVLQRGLFDPSRAKDLTLQALSAFFIGLTALRFLELGRVELPANRRHLAAAAAALLVWLAWSFAHNPFRQASLFPALQTAFSITLFGIILTQTASAGFAAALSGWTSAAAALAAALALPQISGLGHEWPGFTPWRLLGADHPQADGRAFSTMGQPGLLGAFLGLAFPIALAGAADSDRPLARRAASGSAALLCLAGLLASGSPAGLLSLCAGAAAYAALALGAARDPWIRRSGLAAAAAIPLAVWALFALRGPDLQRRLLWDAAVSRGTWAEATRLWRERPWTGIGAGGFAAAFHPHRPDALLDQAGSLADPDASARSEPLQTATELGAVGSALWSILLLGALALALKDASRRLREGDVHGGALLLGQGAGLAGLLAAGCISNVLRAPAPGVLLWMFAGSAGGLALERGSARAWVLPIPAPPAARRLLYVPVLLCAAWALSWPALFYRSDAEYNSGIRFLDQKRWEEALARLDGVSPWHPDGAMARYLAGYLLQDRVAPKNLGAALRHYEEARDLAPTHAGIRYQLGQAYAARGDWENAARSYRECLSLNPRQGRAYADLADALEILGRKNEALAVARERLRARPGDPESWRFLAEQYRARKRFRVARRMLNKASRVDDFARAGGTQSIY